MKILNVEHKTTDGSSSQAGDREVDVSSAQALKAARLKEIEEIKAILSPDYHFPLIDKMAKLFGKVTTEEEIEQMMKEDPRARYILTKKFE
jgi:hypothetical protein